MAKKKKNKKKDPSLPEGQKPQQEQQKKLQVWGLHKTQKVVLTQAQSRYASEVKVITRYQEDNWNCILAEIAKELGIPDRINLKLNYNAMTLTEVPPQPVQSPTTQDLTKVPTS